ncbi:uncharacterized protein LOC125863833 [Solanum stenotomum]|uniref:uncharacterized protein LOC125863833 n=1 Tax=Solanum stenotomum TaxID=172797 RepID=UPI0020D1207C|nr:uncharacterized protein LOC125863833 [Solanum stenotomum]
MELEHKTLWALKNLNVDWVKYTKGRVDHLNKLDEFRFREYESSTLYKERIMKWHDSKILRREFRVGDWVLLYNSRLRLFPRKIKSKWSGPFRVTRVFANGAIEFVGKEGPAFKVQGILRCRDSFCDPPSGFNDQKVDHLYGINTRLRY